MLSLLEGSCYVLVITMIKYCTYERVFYFLLVDYVKEVLLLYYLLMDHSSKNPKLE